MRARRVKPLSKRLTQISLTRASRGFSRKRERRRATIGQVPEIVGEHSPRHHLLAPFAEVYRVLMTSSPRIPPPPMPEVDWSSSSAYLRSCHEWLDAMERWRTDTLPAWIEQTRRYLLEHALLNPDSPVDLPDPRAGTRRLSDKPLDTVAEIRLPSVD